MGYFVSRVRQFNQYNLRKALLDGKQKDIELLYQCWDALADLAQIRHIYWRRRMNENHFLLFL